MQKIIPTILLVLFLVGFKDVDYYISIKKFIELQSSSKSYITNYLETRRWNQSYDKPGTDSTRGMLEWTYNAEGPKAAAFFSLIYTTDEPNRILYQVSSEADRTSLERQIEGLGFKLYKTIVKKTGILKIYRNISHVLLVEREGKAGVFSCYNIEDYMNNIE